MNEEDFTFSQSSRGEDIMDQYIPNLMHFEHPLWENHNIWELQEKKTHFAMVVLYFPKKQIVFVLTMCH